MKKQIVLSCLAFFLIAWQSTGQQVSGRVSGQSDTEPEHSLPGVNIYWAGTTRGVVSDANGNFSIRIQKAADTRLVFSFIGFANDTIDVQGPVSNLKVVLREPNTIQGVTVSERAQTTSISRVDPIRSQHISGCELKKAACCNLSESFETNASVDVNYSDALTGAKVIQMLGLSGNYVQLMLENLPDFQGIHSPYALTFIPGPWLESIQISKGTASVTGGYQSITGQINTELKKPDQKEWLYLNLFGNNSGRMEFNANVSGKINDKLSTMVLAHGAYNDIAIDHGGDNFIDMPLTRRYHLLNRWKYYHGNLMLQAGIGYLEEERIGGQDASFFTDDAPARLYTTFTGAGRLNAFLKGGYSLPGKGDQSIAFLSNYSRNDLELSAGDNSYLGRHNSFNARAIYRIGFMEDKHELNIGVSQYYDEFRENFNDSAFNRIESVPGAFVEYTLKPGAKLTILSGLRYDLHSIYGGFFTPRLHVRYAPSEKWVFRASAGTGRRSPNLFADNSGIIATSHRIYVRNNPTMEIARNIGISTTYYGRLNRRDVTVSLDIHRTDFQNQLILDLESDPHTIYVDNLKGKSYANNAQLEISYEPVKRMQLILAARYTDVKQTIAGQLVEKPYVKQFKGLANISYLSRLQKWQYDATLQLNGKSRLPLSAPCPDVPVMEDSSPAYAILNLQITKNFRRWSLYLGSENVTGFKQHHPIVGYDDPFGKYFDASRIWGPIDGRKIYLGVRLSLEHKS